MTGYVKIKSSKLYTTTTTTGANTYKHQHLEDRLRAVYIHIYIRETVNRADYAAADVYKLHSRGREPLVVGPIIAALIAHYPRG